MIYYDIQTSYCRSFSANLPWPVLDAMLRHVFFTPRLKQHSEACFVQDLLQDAEARLATVKASADEATPKAYVVGS